MEWSKGTAEKDCLCVLNLSQLGLSVMKVVPGLRMKSSNGVGDTVELKD